MRSALTEPLPTTTVQRLECESFHNKKDYKRTTSQALCSRFGSGSVSSPRTFNVAHIHAHKSDDDILHQRPDTTALFTHGTINRRTTMNYVTI